MTTIIADITMSLDGYVTAPNPDLEHGLGVGGEPLHRWAIESDDPVDTEILAASTEQTGAVIMGRRLFDIIDGPLGWNEEMGYGAHHAAVPPVFVVTHAPPESWRLGPRFRFVTEGLAAAVEQARAAAHDRDGKDVVIMGGGDVVAQSIADGLADELRLHLAPLVLGGGTPLFPAGTIHELEQQEVRVSRFATHLRYAVRGSESS
jgi:dihydrofolate reductase